MEPDTIGSFRAWPMKLLSTFVVFHIAPASQHEIGGRVVADWSVGWPSIS